jgi:hypothetical protein
MWWCNWLLSANEAAGQRVGKGDAVVVTAAAAAADGGSPRHAGAAVGAWRREPVAQPRQYHQAGWGTHPTGGSGGGGGERRQAGAADGTLGREPAALETTEAPPSPWPGGRTAEDLARPCAAVRMADDELRCSASIVVWGHILDRALWNCNCHRNCFNVRHVRYLFHPVLQRKIAIVTETV